VPKVSAQNNLDNTPLQVEKATPYLFERSLFSDIYHCVAEVLKVRTVSLIGKDIFLVMIQRNSQFATAFILGDTGDKMKTPSSPSD
jgi:hypothetical protein